MSVRIGVDVGGTFTKAVACDVAGRVIARSVLPTTHEADLGVARGVISAVGAVIDEVEHRGLGPVTLIAHSTTQAVNSLLEGDTATVGILGIGAGPDARKARSRTRVGAIGIAPGRDLATLHSFIDATDGFDTQEAKAALEDLVARGATAIVVSESFGVDDTRAELLALEAARDLGIPACAGHELSGIYGLQLRTVTAAINASILPTALRAADAVASVARERAPGVPLLVMRGDGGAAAIDAMGRVPLLTAFSGPAASVVGALRHLSLRDAIVVEVGGTSSNVSVIKGGRPMLSYIRVLRHMTSVRSLDVRVAGVAGGSMVRLGSRFGRRRVTGVGPRSAHIAGLSYCSFAHGSLDGGRVITVSPRPGDPETYAVIETPEGTRYAPTITCAANALGLVPAGSSAQASNQDAARAAFDLLGAALGRSGEQVARRVIDMAAESISQVARELADEYEVGLETIVGVGGGAGALVTSVADDLGAAWQIPPNAEVISSIGDALSMVRVEVERAITDGSKATVATIVREAERRAIEAGAEPTSVQVETQSLSDRSTLRAVALGAVALQGEVQTDVVADDVRRDAAVAITGPQPEMLAHDEFYSVFGARDHEEGAERPIAVVDRWGSVAWSGTSRPISGTGADLAQTLPNVIGENARRVGPISVAPNVMLLRGARLIDLGLFSKVEPLVDAVVEECSIADTEPVLCLLARSR